MNSAGVRIEEIHKYFHSIKRGKIVALKNIHLEINKGEFFVVLGPSGCGKSTLLNIIAGLEKPSLGEIRFDDRLIFSAKKKYSLSPKQRNVAMVFQSYALYPHMTVFENIAFPLKIARISENEIEKRVKEVAKMLNIEQLLAVKPKELSGGQRQRVAMARSIIRHPYLFLMDEPFSNLDAKLRMRMRSELKTLQNRLKVTTIYVTHDQVEAMILGDRIAVLKDGEIQQIGKPLDVYNNPINTFVAGFLGTPPMNLLDAEIIEKDNNITITVSGMELILPAEKGWLPKVLEKKNFILGIRPEDIDVRSSRTNTGIVGKIKFCEHLGNELLLHFHIGRQEILIKLLEDKGFKAGQMLNINIDFNKILFFNKAGKNLQHHK